MSGEWSGPSGRLAATGLAEVVAALQEGLGDDNLVAVVLFGSRARGEVDEGGRGASCSDWDLLVIARRLPEKAFPRHLELKAMLPAAWRGRVSLLAKTPEEFETRLTALFLDIALDSVVLYDVDGFVTERLARLKQLIEKRGLRRERVQREMVWRWEHPPGPDWALEWDR